MSLSMMLELDDTCYSISIQYKMAYIPCKAIISDSAIGSRMHISKENLHSSIIGMMQTFVGKPGSLDIGDLPSIEF